MKESGCTELTENQMTTGKKGPDSHGEVQRNPCKNQPQLSMAKLATAVAKRRQDMRVGHWLWGQRNPSLNRSSTAELCDLRHVTQHLWASVLTHW